MKKIWQKLGWHLTRPPRMEGIIKNERMNPLKKEKKKFKFVRYHNLPKIHIPPKDTNESQYY